MKPLLALLVASMFAAGSARAAEPAAVPTVAVASSSLGGVADFDAVLQPVRQATLTAPVGGNVLALPAKAGEKVPFLSYASGAYLGRLVEQVIKLSPVPLVLDPIYETDMAEGLKAMALEGHGLAFLPSSSVRKELKAKRLVRAAEPGRFELTMEIRIYRERPEVARHTKPQAAALWDFLARG